MLAPTISFAVQLLPSDIHRAILWLAFRGSKGPWQTRIKFVFYILAAAVGVVSILIADEETRKEVLANFAPLFWVGGFLIVWMVIAPYFSARSTFKNRKGLQALTHYTISDSGIEIETATASRKIGWSAIGLSVETKSYFYFFLGKPSTLIIIPKRSVPGDATITDLRGILRKCLKGKVRLPG